MAVFTTQYQDGTRLNILGRVMEYHRQHYIYPCSISFCISIFTTWSIKENKFNNSHSWFKTVGGIIKISSRQFLNEDIQCITHVYESTLSKAHFFVLLEFREDEKSCWCINHSIINVYGLKKKKKSVTLLPNSKTEGKENMLKFSHSWPLKINIFDNVDRINGQKKIFTFMQLI